MLRSTQKGATKDRPEGAEDDSSFAAPSVHNAADNDYAEERALDW
jgi:hypothetical protein